MNNTERLTKQQLAQKRNYFKFVLTGMVKPVDLNALTVDEQFWWKSILFLRKDLLENFENNSKEFGLNVSEYRCCICNKKEAKYFDGEAGFGYCYKHYKKVYEY